MANPRLLTFLALSGALASAHSSQADDIRFKLDAGDALVVEDSGATQRLSVEEATGNINRNGVLFVHTSGATSNTFVGGGSGSLLVTSSDNTGFGFNALDSLTGGYGSNTAVGSRAGESIDTGFFNTLVGTGAGGDLIAGYGNSLVGTGAGAFLTGSYNTAVGRAALQSAGGTRNVAIGTGAGGQLTSGDHNIYLGTSSGTGGQSTESGQLRIGSALTTQAHIQGIHGNSVAGPFVTVDSTGRLGSTSTAPPASTVINLPPNEPFVVQNSTQTVDRFRIEETTGNIQRNDQLFIHTSGANDGLSGFTSNSVFVGPSAGNTAAVGIFNTGVGEDSLSSLTTGFYNTAHGADALGNLKAGNSNTAMGHDALASNANGNTNTAVGKSALSNNVGSNNIAIGFAAGVANTTGSDNIYIGNSGGEGQNGRINIGQTGVTAETWLMGPAVTVQGALTVGLNMSAKTVTIRGGGDIAEPFDVAPSELSIEPGMLVAIDPDHPGALRLSETVYDRSVAGVISGAGGVHPGLTLTQEGSIADGTHPVALTGRVYAWVDADAGGSIQPGDLLTTSARRGHAMKATDPVRSQGAVLGKAMTSLDEGQGLVLVLVSLQ